MTCPRCTASMDKVKKTWVCPECGEIKPDSTHAVMRLLRSLRR